MKYLLVAHLAQGYDNTVDSSSWFVGETGSAPAAVDLATKTVEEYVDAQVANYLELDPDAEDFTKEELADIEWYKSTFKVEITNIRIPSNKIETVATMKKVGDNWMDYLTIDVIKVGA